MEVGKIFENFVPQFPDKEVKGGSNHEWKPIDTKN
jgi:hypothetical protein